MSLPERSTDPVSLFYSYSHKDERLRDQLETHLSLLQTQGVIRGWHDRRIEAGTEWDGAINQNLEDAGIILLLVSADFFASRYCHDVEVARAMARHEAGTARVIPVILRPVAEWHSALFGKLQALPKDGRPVTKWETATRRSRTLPKASARPLGASRPGRRIPRPRPGPSPGGPPPPCETQAVGRSFWNVLLSEEPRLNIAIAGPGAWANTEIHQILHAEFASRRMPWLPS